MSGPNIPSSASNQARSMRINIKLLPVKAHYFFFNAAGSCLWPFITVIGKQMGISADAVGVVFAIAPITGCLAKPVFGLLADRLKKRKKTFLFFLILALTTSISLSFLPQKSTVRPVVFQCGNLGTNYLIQSDLGPEKDKQDVINNILKQNNEENRTNDTLSYKKEIGLELCHVQCEIHGFIEGSDFCKNIDLGSQTRAHLPDRCGSFVSSSINNQRYQISRDETLEDEIEDINTDPIQLSSTSNQLMIQNPYILYFDVLLKLESTVIVGGSTYFHIDKLSFSSKNNSFGSKQIPKPSFHSFSCYEKTSLTNCFLDCPESPQLNKALERVPEDIEYFESSSFWLYGGLVILAFAAFAVATSVSDALCFQTLGSKPQFYGQQRQWGAVGWGIFTLVAGYLIDTRSEGELLKDYSSCFYLLTVLYILDIIVVYKWEIKEEDRPKQIRRDIWNLVTDLRVIIFSFACLIVGMCTGLLWNFLFWYVEDVAAMENHNLKWIKVLQGVMAAVQCFSELPFFHFSGWFLKKLGYTNAMTLVLACFGIRFVIYSLLLHPWAFIPIEIFQGITYGIFYSLMTSYASEISPPGAASTIQGLVGAIFEGLGTSLGNLIGGILMNTWGGSTAFRLFGIGALIFAFLHSILSCFIRKFDECVSGRRENVRTEEDGQEMYKMNGVSQDVDADGESLEPLYK